MQGICHWNYSHGPSLPKTLNHLCVLGLFPTFPLTCPTGAPSTLPSCPHRLLFEAAADLLAWSGQRDRPKHVWGLLPPASLPCQPPGSRLTSGSGVRALNSRLWTFPHFFFMLRGLRSFLCNLVFPFVCVLLVALIKWWWLYVCFPIRVIH